MSWYNIEKIDERLYRITEPHHWEFTNLYYFIGDKRNLLIDTGTGLKPLKELLESIDNKPIDVVITHGHWDHVGNVHEFENVYVHDLDLDWVKNGSPLPRAVLIGNIVKDVKSEYLEGFIEPPLKHDNPNPIDEYSFEGLDIHHTPGHSPGSVSIYDKNRKALFAGDILYEGTIYCHFESTDPEDLFDSMKLLKTLDVKVVYSGHYNSPKVTMIDDLYEIMNGLKGENKLSHGGGKHCRNEVCLQL